MMKVILLLIYYIVSYETDFLNIYNSSFKL